MTQQFQLDSKLR